VFIQAQLLRWILPTEHHTEMILALTAGFGVAWLGMTFVAFFGLQRELEKQ
jgi:hypothetical protein